VVEQAQIPEAAESDLVQFDYLKANLFRVLHVDGVIGSVAPSGLIHMALFSEREAIPKSVRHEIDEEGKLGDIVGLVSRASYVREVDANVVLSVETAEEIVTWLNDKIQEFRVLGGEQ
jgi:hypothetical protein